LLLNVGEIFGLIGEKGGSARVRELEERSARVGEGNSWEVRECVSWKRGEGGSERVRECANGWMKIENVKRAKDFLV